MGGLCASSSHGRQHFSSAPGDQVSAVSQAGAWLRGARVWIPVRVSFALAPWASCCSLAAGERQPGLGAEQQPRRVGIGLDPLLHDPWPGKGWAGASGGDFWRRRSNVCGVM